MLKTKIFRWAALAAGPQLGGAFATNPKHLPPLTLPQTSARHPNGMTGRSGAGPATEFRTQTRTQTSPRFAHVRQCSLAYGYSGLAPHTSHRRMSANLPGITAGQK